MKNFRKKRADEGLSSAYISAGISAKARRGSNSQSVPGGPCINEPFVLSLKEASPLEIDLEVPVYVHL